MNITGLRKKINVHQLIHEYAPNKSFIDIGALWGVHGAYAFYAEECGAERVVALDIYPASQEFLAEKQKRNSNVAFIQGDINSADTLDRIGVHEVVFCKGVLYHQPDPVQFLLKLRQICSERLLLGTALIPEMNAIRNGAVFYPYLDAKQRSLWKKKKGRQRGLSTVHEPESGYGNWFWGLTPSCVESLLACAGFKVEERYLDPFLGFFDCQVTADKFTATSGEWTVPKHYGYRGSLGRT